MPRSFPGGELGDLWPWYPGYDGYPPEGEFERRMEGKRIETFTGQRGTLIFCNTSGFHRGGYARRQAARAGDLDVLLPGGPEGVVRTELHADHRRRRDGWRRPPDTPCGSGHRSSTVQSSSGRTTPRH